MPEKLEKQLDLFNKPVVKTPKRIFDENFMKKTFGDHGVAPAEDSDKPSQDESMGRPESHPRRKFRPPYPEGHDGNPIITKDPEEQKKINL